MPYVIRDADGRVSGLTRDPAGPDADSLPPDHPEILAFLFGAEGGSGHFLAADLALIRVVEDVIAVLVEKQLIAITDLPPAAQDKLFERRSLRAFLGGIAALPEADGDGAKVI